jgi:hypothetical protein
MECWAYKETSNGVKGHEAHDGHDQVTVELSRGDAHQGTANRQLDDADGYEKDGLADKVELHADHVDIRINIAFVSSSTMAQLSKDDALTCPSQGER